MEWLGIHVPDNLQEDFRGSKNMLEKSVQVCLDIAAELTTFCADRSIPFGFNIESVAVRSDEIEASVYLVNKVREILVQGGIRKTEVSTFSANTIRDLNEEGVAIDKDKRQVNIIK
jgi:hypothetical protein